MDIAKRNDTDLPPPPGDSIVRLGRVERARNWFRSKALFGLALLFSILAAFYWLFVASDRYVSVTHVIVERTDLTVPTTPDLNSIIAGDVDGDRGDQLIMRDFLLSRDVVRRLDEELNLSAHYSDPAIDIFSRLGTPATLEELHEYYLDRVRIEYDEYAGVLVIEPQAFDPETAQRLSSTIITLGETFMNESANQLAGGQIDFLENQVDQLQSRVVDARQRVLAYQNRNRIASPEAQADAIGSLVAQLEGRKSELEVQLASQSSYLVSGHPVLVELRRQIAAIDGQIAEQTSRLTGERSQALNAQAEQLAQLEAEAQFAEQLYQSALTSLEQARVESIRTAKSLSVIQQPTTPEQAVMPKRWLKTFTYIFFAFLLAGIAQLLAMIVRDHKD